MGGSGLDVSGLEQEQSVDCSEYGKEFSVSIICRKFLTG